MNIADAAKITGLTPKSIRFYEENHLVTPKRCENRYRDFNQADIDRLNLITTARNAGCSIEECQVIVNALSSVNPDTKAAAKARAKQMIHIKVESALALQAVLQE